MLSLRTQPFLLAPRRSGRFARGNVCALATEIPKMYSRSIADYFVADSSRLRPRLQMIFVTFSLLSVIRKQ